MKKSITNLMEQLDGKWEDGEYIAEVSKNLYNMTIEDFFKGRERKEDSIEYLYNRLFDIRTENNNDEEDIFLQRMYSAQKMTMEEFRKMKFGNALICGDKNRTIEKDRAYFLLYLILGLDELAAPEGRTAKKKKETAMERHEAAQSTVRNGSGDKEPEKISEKISIEELLRMNADIFPTEVREYVYLGVRPFLLFYRDEIRKLMGDREETEFLADCDKACMSLYKEDDSDMVFLIDYIVYFLKNHRERRRFEGFLEAVFMKPMRIAQEKIEECQVSTVPV